MVIWALLQRHARRPGDGRPSLLLEAHQGPCLPLGAALLTVPDSQASPPGPQLRHQSRWTVGGEGGSKRVTRQRQVSAVP